MKWPPRILVMYGGHFRFGCEKRKEETSSLRKLREFMVSAVHLRMCSGLATPLIRNFSSFIKARLHY
jgi:hypothetical protein